MSKFSIYDQDWLNLVFEGKNQAYGAYQLRRENSRTTLLAFLSGLLLVAALGALAFVFSSFSGKADVPLEIPKLDDPLTLHHVEIEAIKPPPAAVAPLTPPAPLTEVNAPVLRNPVIVRPDLTTDIIPENRAIVNEPTLQGTGTGTGTDSGTAATTGTGTVVDAPAITEDVNKPVGTAALDKLPEYPGGIAKFYQYVAYNFEKPEVNTTVQVLVSFVIERDGSMTDIRVLRNPGYGLDKEALRVLKSLKIKWAPGMKGGKAMRTQYTLPIKVTPNN